MSCPDCGGRGYHPLSPTSICPMCRGTGIINLTSRFGAERCVGKGAKRIAYSNSKDDREGPDTLDFWSH